MAGDPAVLHALAAGVGAGGPLPGLPLERAGEAVAQAGRLGLVQHPALSLVGALPSPPAPPAPAPEEGGPLGRGGGQAESVVDHPPAVADVHALNNSGGGAATARLGALEKIIVWRSPPFSNSVLPSPYLRPPCPLPEVLGVPLRLARLAVALAGVVRAAGELALEVGHGLSEVVLAAHQAELDPAAARLVALRKGGKINGNNSSESVMHAR